MKYMNTLTLLTFGLLFTACTSSLGNSKPNGGNDLDPNSIDLTLTGTPRSNELTPATKRELLDAINAKRTSGFTCPAPVGNRPAVNAVTWNGKLEQMALKHTNVLVNVNADFAKVDPHTGVGDGNVAARAAGVGYAYSALGENIAAGQLNISEAMNDWLASAGHCQAIMDADFTQIGASKLSTNGGAYATYWTLNFGKPQ
jgi:uncharacterized protein YkwD